jgi:hypothetical protein
MKLRPGEAKLLGQIQEAGTDGVLWNRSSSAVAARLQRMGLIEFRIGPVVGSEGGSRTGIRYVVVNDRRRG